jgi:hypothetical protein
VLGLALLVGLLFPRDAFAYLDPGSGSLVFQTIVAGIAGVAYGVRVYWSRISGWFKRGSSSSSNAQTGAEGGPEPTNRADR